MNPIVYLDFLRRQQQADGSFIGWASQRRHPFKQQRRQDTIFPTILLLDSLQRVVGAEDIRRNAAAFIQTQMSKQGSWNYWRVTSAVRKNEPYPDDLDDTACAMAALMRQDASWVDPARLGAFARLLVAAEQAVGGPYNTWLIDTVETPQWRHIDPAVNANIGYALAQQAVLPGSLKAYIEQIIEQDNYQSAYYVGELPTIYFICRWYSGRLQSLLRQKITTMLLTPPADSLQLALLLLSALHLGVPLVKLRHVAAQLQRQGQDDHWAASALYIDPVYDGQQHYGGSEAITTAFALAALTAYATPISSLATPLHKRVKAGVMPQVRQDASHIPNTALRREYIEHIRRMFAAKDAEQVCNVGALLSKVVPWQVSKPTQRLLSLASVNGWLAYTQYDAVLDGGAVRSINLANIAHRRSFNYFMRAAGESTALQSYVQQVFDTMDSANAWELAHARASVINERVQVRSLPDFGDYGQLAERSLGHSLPGILVMAHHYELHHAKVATLQQYYRHFLIARQLNDDAHDWEDDLRAGRITAVVALLLSTKRTVHLNTDMDALRLQFWRHTIDEVADLIAKHLRLAEAALELLGETIDSSVFYAWTASLARATAMAQQKRNEALQFIRAYEEKYAE